MATTEKINLEGCIRSESRTLRVENFNLHLQTNFSHITDTLSKKRKLKPMQETKTLCKMSYR